MKLAPRMIQAMEILQLPLMALQERIETELSSNPVLELREGADAQPESQVDEAPGVADERPLVVREDGSQAEDFQRLEAFDREYEPQIWEGESYRPPRPAAGERDAKLDAMANAPAPAESLYEHLRDQWAFVEADEPVRQAGELILQHLDDDGYLREPLEGLPAQTNRLITPEDLRAALALVQGLEPIGVGARDLRECLLIQLAAKEAAGEDVSLQRELVRSFLRDIQANRLPLIARKLKRPLEEVRDAIEALSHLNPRPGLLIGQRAAPIVVPDIMVELDEDGEPVVLMTDSDLPALQINRGYRRMLRDRGVDRQAKEFLQRNIRSAQWLIEAIQQRRHTVRRVAEEVFAVQKDFFERGPAALKPLPMTDVAERVGVHVATVSRAVAGKYVQTPRGIFPLRMFFSGGTTTDSGTEVAWDAVKAKLQEIVNAEDKAHPLNDDELVDALKAAGIEIARRTVAKYRGLLNIPPARQRRRHE